MPTLSEKRLQHHEQMARGKSTLKKQILEFSATIPDGSYYESNILDLSGKEGKMEVVGTTTAVSPDLLLYEVWVSQDGTNFFKSLQHIVQTGNTLGSSWDSAFRYCRLKVSNSTGVSKDVHILFSSL
tara:strand:+ start:1226 stop:1606 length:381 start_codon:yes stop_codon:yes gene_type:complete